MDFLCVLIVGCLSLQAPIAPPPIPASSSAYNEHSTLGEYVVTTNYIDDDTGAAALAARSHHKPFEGYWLDDPVHTAALIDEYNVGTVSSTRPAAKPIGSAAFRKVHGEGRSAVRAVKKDARRRPTHRLEPGPRAVRRDHALRADQRLVASPIKLQ
jgi:hypothetical protein